MRNIVASVSQEGAESHRRDKRAKFVELAEKRTVNAIRAIRTISKLGNRAHYDYDENDVRKIVAALNKEIEALKAKMSGTADREAIKFKL